ncbi:MAG: GTP-binding protein [Egibacteraceae bacterium]
MEENGAISELGSVDGGNMQTDTNELERERGITIRSAVASFALGDLQINLVDTPGHPDFIAEVERALSVLDGAVLVISAVEGVQAQTRVLMRSLKRMRLPTLIFVNKIDRMGARHDDLLAEIRKRLTPAIVPMERVSERGTRGASVITRSFDDETFSTEVAELLADHDDELRRHIVDESVPAREDLRELLKEQTNAGLVHPVFFGSALSGAGTTELTDGVRAFLPVHHRSAPDDGLCGTVFAIERGSKGEKIAYLRLFSGNLHDRQRVTFRRREAGGAVQEYRGRIAGLEVIGAGSTGSGVRSRPGPLTPGSIAKLRGLPQVRVGDQLGEPDGAEPQAHFSPPILESIMRSQQPGEEPELHAALTQLADEDPFIRTRTAGGGATSVLLYGVVQKEVIAERLKREFGVEAVFEQVQPVSFERPIGVGNALWEFEPRGPNEFWQTVGLRIEPTPFGVGNTFTREVGLGLLPRAYYRAIEDAAMATLQQGLHGWEVTDCSVILTHVGYEAPMTGAADFRNLTPMVLMQALEMAGSDVYEPSYTIEVEVPDDALSGVIGFLLSLGADIGQSTETGSTWVIPGEIPARLLQDLVIALPRLTHGEGTIWYEPGHDRQVCGPVPVRERFDGNPRNHDEYVRFLANRSPGHTAAR